MKINVKNTEKLNAAIAAAEGRATARCITADDIQRSIEQIEKRLTEGFNICKKDWTGMIFALDPNSQSFPSAYQYTPESTKVFIKRYPSGWFVTYIARLVCKPNRHIVDIYGTDGLIKQHAKW